MGRKEFWNQVAEMTLFLHSFTLEAFFGTFQESQAQMVYWKNYC